MPDLDQMFQYCTPKYVYIRDAKLGITKYFLMMLIFVYVILYEILYTCNHLVPATAQGFGTITLQHPMHNCDEFDAGCLAKFINIKHLEYCKQNADARKLKEAVVSDSEEDGKANKAKGTGSEEDGKANKAEHKAEDKGDGKKTLDKEPKVGDDIATHLDCQYLDSRRLSWMSDTPSEIFVPTHYQSITETKNPDCYDPFTPDADGTGKEKYVCKTPWIVKEKRDIFVADIESFSLHIEHSFNCPALGEFGISQDFQGLLAACKTNHPKDIKAECKRMKVPSSPGAIAAEDAAGLSSPEEVGVSTLRGTASGKDEISLHDLLRVTPVAQRNDMKVILDTELGKDFGHPGKSLRDVGGVLLLDVNYANDGIGRSGIPGLQSISPVDTTIKPITYSYRPYFVPTNMNKKSQLTQASDTATTRTVDIWYGITIKMQFNGQLVAFSWSKVLKALTTGLVLLTMATTITTALASYILPLKEKYKLLMFQMSEDFSDFSHLRAAKGEAGIEKMTANFVSGDLLKETLGPDGRAKQELPNPELVQILAITEMRLGRLDGMDPVMTFPTAGENNVLNKAIGHAEKNFAQKHGTIDREVSYKVRLGAGAE